MRHHREVGSQRQSAVYRPKRSVRNDQGPQTEFPEQHTVQTPEPLQIGSRKNQQIVP